MNSTGNKGSVDKATQYAFLALAALLNSNVSRPDMLFRHRERHNPPMPSSGNKPMKLVFWRSKRLVIQNGTSLFIFSNSASQALPIKVTVEAQIQYPEEVLEAIKAANFVCVARDADNARRKRDNYQYKGIQ